MKKTITLLLLAVVKLINSQTIADFESYTLPADSFYYSASSTDFQTSNAIFEYEWATSSFGNYWASGFAYTNKHDSSNGGYTHLYNCIAYKGYNSSNFYVTGQNNGIIKLKTATDNVVNGFYITNTTYAYKSMKSGDSFAKKFGGASGNDPDWFKVTVKGYLNGSMKSDSSEFYLADFRFSNNALDYIVKGWQYMNCSNLGVVDSIQFFMYSSDNSSFGMNTPAFFSIDNFSTSQGVGIHEFDLVKNVQLFPNPASTHVNLNMTTENSLNGSLSIFNTLGVLVKQEKIELQSGVNQHRLDLSGLESGLYFIEISSSTTKQSFKLIKN